MTLLHLAAGVGSFAAVSAAVAAALIAALLGLARLEP
jgi:hypothetical protein